MPAPKSKGRTAAPKPIKTPTPRTWANLTITFGLVQIPVAIGKLTEDRRSDVSGKMLCAEHLKPVSQLWHCEHTDDEHEHGHDMAKADTVIGYDVGNDKYVTLSEETVADMVAERETEVAVHRMVPGPIDPIFYEKHYLVWPAETGGQTHDLFAELLKDTDSIALVKATLGKSTRLFAIRWSEDDPEKGKHGVGCLVMSQLHFDTDIRFANADLIKTGMAARASGDKTMLAHLDLAKQIAEGLEGDFEADDVEDVYTEMLRGAIEAAAKGKAPKKPAAKKAAPAPATDNLMEQLRASVPAAKPKTRAKVAA